MQTRIVPSKPALIVEGTRKNVVVTDLHIGFEGALASNEIFVGKNTTTLETIEEIESIINKERPDAVILLGDIKSSISNISKTEWNEVPLFLERLRDKSEIVLVPGNHDAGIQRLVPDGISMISTLGMIEEDVLFTHGHAMPSSNYSHVEKIIMGHVHPVFFQEESVLNGQRVWVSLKTEKSNIFPDKNGEIEIVIVPSFNKYFYATHKRKYKRSISPIIEKIKDVSSARIVTLDGTIIGNELDLEKVL